MKNRRQNSFPHSSSLMTAMSRHSERHFLPFAVLPHLWFPLPRLLTLDYYSSATMSFSSSSPSQPSRPPERIDEQPKYFWRIFLIFIVVEVDVVVLWYLRRYINISRDEDYCSNPYHTFPYLEDSRIENREDDRGQLEKYITWAFFHLFTHSALVVHLTPPFIYGGAQYLQYHQK